MTTTSPYPEPYQAFPNSFKMRLVAGQRLIGCWASLSNAITTAILGVAGVDWLLLDGEHAPNDVGTFVPQLMALKDMGHIARGMGFGVVRIDLHGARVVRLASSGGSLGGFIQLEHDHRIWSRRSPGLPA